MKIGKGIETHKAPKRKIRKWNQKPDAIPVELPKRKTQEVTKEAEKVGA